MAMVRWRRWRTEDVSGVRVRSPGRGWRILPRDIGDTAIGPPSPLSRLSSVPGRWWPCLCSLLLHPHFVCKSDSPSWHVVYNLSLKLSEASASPTQLLQESSHAAVLQGCRSASVVFSACSTRNYRDQEFIFTHSTRINWPSILERNTKIRIPHIPASVDAVRQRSKSELFIGQKFT